MPRIIDTDPRHNRKPSFLIHLRAENRHLGRTRPLLTELFEVGEEAGGHAQEAGQ